MTRLVLLLKSGLGSGSKIAHQGGYAMYGNPPRWHKITAEKPAPKGAPVAHHPEAAGVHEATGHFTDAMMEALKLPDSNVNAPSYNKALAKLKEWSDAGNITAIVGAGYGSNTYGQKLAKIANHLLGNYGSPHMVTAGQKAGTHKAVTAPPAKAEPSDAKTPAEHGAAAFAEGKPASPAHDPAFAPKVAGKKDAAEQLNEWSSGYAEAKEAATPKPTGPLTMPEFDEGKSATGVKSYYEHLAQKVIDHGHSGNVAVLEDMPNPEKGNAWKGKTANSKKLMALHAAALAHAKGGAQAAPAAPTKVTGLDDAVALESKIASGPDDAVGEINNALFSNYDEKFVLKNAAGKVTAAIAYGVSEAPGENSVEVHHIGSVDKGSGSKLLALAKDFAKKKGLPIKLYATKNAVGFYEKQGFSHVGSKTTDAHGSLMQWASAPDTGPKEGDTKPGANGKNLVFKNGRWHKYVDVDEHGELPAKLVPVDAPASAALTQNELQTPNVMAKLALANIKDVEGLALAGDVAGVEKFIADLNEAGGNDDYIPLVHAKKLLAKMKAKQAPAPAADDLDSPEDMAADFTKPAAPTAVGQVDGPLKDMMLGAKLESYSKEKLEDYAANHPNEKIKAHAQATLAAKHSAAPSTGALSAQHLQNLQSIPWFKLKLPDSNTNAKSHNAALAKIEAMAFAGDKAGLAAFVASKAGAKQTYAKKQGLVAQTALAALGAEGATAAVPVEPAPAAAAPAPAAADKYPLVNEWKAAISAGKVPTKAQADAYEALVESDPDSATEYFMDAVNNLIPEDKLGDDGAFDDALQEAHSKAFELQGHALKGTKPPVTADTPLTQGQKDAVDSMSPGEWEAIVGTVLPPNVEAYIKKKLARLEQAAAPAQPTKVKVPAQVFHNTKGTHNKSWSVSVHGSVMKTEYGKIGGTQQSTVKDLGTPEAAAAMVATLIKQKGANGYVKKPFAVDHEHDAAPGAPVEQGPKEGDTKMGADGMLVLKNGHWVKVDDGKGKALTATQLKAIEKGYSGHAKTTYKNVIKPAALAGDVAALQKWKQESVGKLPNTNKMVDAILAAMGAGAAPTPTPAQPDAPAPAVGIPAMDAWTQTGEQQGSNKGGKFKDPTGQEWYCKFPGDADTAKSEILAAHLYGLAGLSGQDAQLVTKDGKVGIASKWVNIKKAGSAAALAKVDGALSGFAVDAWLGNWDVVGMGLDNLQIGPDGKAHRVDAGGSLEYRAQGEKKPFGAKVEEIDTLRDAKKNPHAAAVFGKITEADLLASVAKVAAIDDAAIRALVHDHGPGTEAQRKALADTLIARKQDLIARFPKIAKPAKKALDPTALPVNAALLPKPHDFSNWNGQGNGLSSKAHVNKANEGVEYQMLALAQAGNMVAVRQFQFAEVNKDTGAPTGKMLPIGQHPSKHVQQYQQDLLQVLDEVANPPQALKVFRSTEVGTLASLSAAFPPKKFGTTVAKVQSNEKLGFWVALGAVGNPDKFKPKTLGKYTATAIAKAKEKYSTASKLAKHFISSVQASGSYNDLFRDGKTHDHAGNSLKDVAQAALAHATEMPEGTCLYRWQKMSPQMLQHIMSAKDGTVFQATGPMCTSYDPTATKGFGTHRVKVVYAKGAKAVESFASGAFKGEQEVTTLPNARFVILSKTMVPDVEHGNPSSQRLELEILMLPPDLGIH